MIGRLLRIFFVSVLIALIIARLFGRRKKHLLHEIIQISAWVLIAVSAAVLLAYRFTP